MKKTIVLSLLALIFAATQVFAQSGNLIVTGELGVGTTAPEHAVDVVGDVNVTGSYRVNGVSLPGGLTGAISGLTITNDAASPNTKIDVTANFIGTVVPSGTMGIDCTTSSLPAGNDLDAGSLVPNTWYYIWAIYNGTTMAGLASTSRTSPTLPANYANAYTRLIGVAKTATNGPPQFLAFVQQGNHFVYDASQWATSGATIQNWTVQNCSAYIPPISTRGSFQVYIGTSSTPISAFVRKNGSTSGGHFMGSAGSTDTWSTVNDFVDTDSSQSVQININNAASSGGGWFLNVNGFELNL